MRSISKEKIRELYERYERRFTSLGFVFGFVMDTITLQRIDLLFENIVLFSYVLLAGISIAVFNFWESGKLRGAFFDAVSPWLPFVMQIAFGGVFSGYVVFYARSGSLAASWPFVLILVVLLIGNEFFRKRYQQLVFQISVFYIAVFSFAIFFLPVVFKAMGAGMFILSGVVSLLIMGGFVYMLFHMVPSRMRERWRAAVLSIGALYAGMHILYFLNIIPPIPLSLKDAGAYHQVVRGNGGYRATLEDYPWYAFLLPSILHIEEGAPVYFYSAVFAPTRLSTAIVHEWRYYDEQQSAWVVRSRVAFPIAGGRDGGYRGYSLKTNLDPGVWRVNVETERGQVIGRRTFRVERAAEKPVFAEQML
ncbi:MAG: DUF2914 domain-containing protein [Patescibacteria group bacterium]